MIIFIILYIILTNLSLIFIKLGGPSTQFAIKDQIFNFSIHPFLILGMVTYICSFVLWMYIINKFDLSYIYPVVTGINYLVTIALAFSILHEQINNYQKIGVAVILLGVVLMNIKK